MAQPIIIVKENGLVVEVRFIGNPGALDHEIRGNAHVILRWPDNQMSKVGESEVVLDKQLGESPRFEIRLQAKETPEQTGT